MKNCILKSTLSLCAVWAILNCSDKPNEVQKQDVPVFEVSNEQIMITFMVDDSIISLNDDFTLCLIADKDTIICPSKNNYVSLSLPKSKTYEVLFTYHEYKLNFGGLNRGLIMPTQEMEWKFGIDNRPFNNLLGLLSYKEFKEDTTTKQLLYLMFNPMEEGCGIVCVNKIE